MNKQKLGYFLISGSWLMHALTRVSEGEDPEIVYMEIYANSEQDADV